MAGTTKLAAVLAAALLASAAAGCGGSGGNASGGDGSPEAKRFVSLGCASCHTLAAVGANGRIGPDLDTLRPSTAAVERQVTNGGPGMPSFKDRLKPAEIHALAVWVAGNAGKG